jgi:hypothetical protein
MKKVFPLIRACHEDPIGKRKKVFPLIRACHEDPIGKRKKWFNVTPTSFSFAIYVHIPYYNPLQNQMKMTLSFRLLCKVKSLQRA